MTWQKVAGAVSASGHCVLHQRLESGTGRDMQTLTQSPTDPVFVQNPYPVYAAARAQDAIWLWDAYAMPCAVSYDAVRMALRDRRLGRACPAALQTPQPDHLADFYAVEAHSMLELEPPVHTRLRNHVLRAFTSRRIMGLAPEIAALADRLIDTFPTEPFDLLTAFAKPLPVIVIARLLGVPESEAPQLLAWSNAMVAMYQANRTTATEVAANQAAVAFTAYLTEVIATKARAPGDDLISALIAATADAEKLSHDEMITTCILLLNAGHEATVHTLGNATKVLLETGDRDITDSCVEELLRFDPPLHLFTRYVYAPIEIAGHHFAPGDQIACLLGAANRDPAVFTNPDTFDPNRPITQNTSFGGGIHFCVGAPLARLEIKIALTRLFARCPNLRLAAPPRYADIYHFHGLESLMVQT